MPVVKAMSDMLETEDCDGYSATSDNAWKVDEVDEA